MFPLFPSKEISTLCLKTVDSAVKIAIKAKDDLYRPIFRIAQRNGTFDATGARNKINAFMNKCLQSLRQHPEIPITIPGERQYPPFDQVEGCHIEFYETLRYHLVPSLEQELEQEFDAIEKEVQLQIIKDDWRTSYSVQAGIILLILMIGDALKCIREYREKD